MAGPCEAGVSPKPLNLRMDGHRARPSRRRGRAIAVFAVAAVALVWAAGGLSSDGSSAAAKIAAAVAGGTMRPTAALTHADHEGAAWVAS
jgi:hypothetical protein